MGLPLPTHNKEHMEVNAVKTRTTFKQRAVEFIADPMSIPKIRRDLKRREGAIAAIAMKGDMFWNSGRTRELSTAKGLQEGYKTMDKTFHDLDHGANPNMGLHIRIEDIVGFHDYTEYNPETKDMIIYIYPHEDMPSYKTWKSFLDLCKKAGKNPNVSVEYMSTDEKVKAKDLEGIDYKQYGINDDDDIWVERSYRFLGAATVNIGAFSDEDGGGIQQEDETNSTYRVSMELTDTDTEVITMEEEQKNEELEALRKEVEELKKKLEEPKEEPEPEPKEPEDDSEEEKAEKMALEERILELEKQLKEASTANEKIKELEKKLTKPVTTKSAEPVSNERIGIQALNLIKQKLPERR